MTSPPRAILAMLAALSVPHLGSAQESGEAAALPRATTVTDVRGRTVTVPDGPPRLAIDDGRYLLALSLLVDDPVAALAGWPHDAHRVGRGTYERYLDRFPALADKGRVSSSASPFSLEQTLAAAPTVAVFSLNRGPDDDDVRRLEAAGVSVVFIDFFMDPLRNVDRSLEILGALVGRPDRAARFVRLRTQARRTISARLAERRPPAPDVFFETHAGMSPECCTSPGSGNVSVYIDFAGGHNIGADVLPGPTGTLSLEYVLDRDPDVYVATGGPHLAAGGGLVLGPGYGSEEASASLAEMATRPGIGLLTAVATGRTHGLSHHLLNSPLDVVALQLLARWIHPDLFGDLDPRGTLERINRAFLVLPVEGTHWTTLRDHPKERP